MMTRRTKTLGDKSNNEGWYGTLLSVDVTHRFLFGGAVAHELLKIDTTLLAPFIRISKFVREKTM